MFLSKNKNLIITHRVHFTSDMETLPELQWTSCIFDSSNKYTAVHLFEKDYPTRYKALLSRLDFLVFEELRSTERNFTKLDEIYIRYANNIIIIEDTFENFSCIYTSGAGLIYRENGLSHKTIQIENYFYIIKNNEMKKIFEIK